MVRRSGQRGLRGTAATISRLKRCRVGGDDRAEAVLGLPWARSGRIGAQVRRHVVHDPLEAKPLKGATKLIRELVKIERLAGNRGALHDLAFEGRALRSGARFVSGLHSTSRRRQGPPGCSPARHGIDARP
jgi:hypothetical protein